MFYRRESFRIFPEKVSQFNDFFHGYVLPNHVKNGAKLIGRWLTEEQDELIVLWEYPSFEEYLQIEKRVIKDDMYKSAQIQLQKLGQLFKNYQQDYLTSTGVYNPETKDVRFVKIDLENASQYIKRGKFIPRVLDAMKDHCIPYEAFKVRPYELLKRLNGNM